MALGVQVNNETIGACPSLQEENNYNMEFPNVDDSFRDFNFYGFMISIFFGIINLLCNGESLHN